MQEFLYYVADEQGRIVAGFDDIEYAQAFARAHTGFYLTE